MEKLSLKKKKGKLPTKAEKALAIAEVLVNSSQATIKTFEIFGNNIAAAAMSASHLAAAMAQIGRIKATPTQPEEHPLAKAVREVIKNEQKEG